MLRIFFITALMLLISACSREGTGQAFQAYGQKIQDVATDLPGELDCAKLRSAAQYDLKAREQLAANAKCQK